MRNALEVRAPNFSRQQERLLGEAALLGVLILAVGGTGSTNAAPPEHSFTAASLDVPAGYTVQLAAASPLVAHPLMASLDNLGRLYLAANAGRNLSREDLEKRAAQLHPTAGGYRWRWGV